MSNNSNDFFMNFKLPTYLPNERPKEELPPPASLPSKPPVTLPAIPRVNKPPPRSQPNIIPPIPIPIEKQKEIPQEDEQDSEKEEEEDPYLAKQQNAPIPIPGTTIVLSTDEDIAKWIEERKKNWPSKKRMEEKQKESLNKRGNDDAFSSLNKKQKRYCKFFIRGTCRNQHCPNLHEIPVKPIQNNKLVYHHDIPINIPERYSRSINSGKSLHNLVIEHDYYKFENEKILNVIEQLVQNGYIKSNYEKYKKS